MAFGRETWLQKRLEEWKSAGLISSDQARAIGEHQRVSAARSRVSPVSIMAAFGGLCVAVGIILVVSFNWEKIPSLTKIACFLIALLGSAEAVNRLGIANKIGSIAMQVIWLMLPLAGIGLWGQIYQISGDPFKPLLVWLVISLPLVWLGRNMGVAAVHTAGIIVAIYVGAFSKNNWISLYFRTAELPFADFARDFAPAVLLIGILWAAAFWQVRKLLGGRGSLIGLIGLLAFLWALTVFPTPFSSRMSILKMLVLSSFPPIYWGLIRFLPGDRRKLEKFGLLASLGVLYILTFGWHMHGHYWRQQNLAIYPIVYTALIAVCGIVLCMEADFRLYASSAAMGRWLKGFILSALLLAYGRFGAGAAESLSEGLTNLVIVGFAMFLIFEGIKLGTAYKVNYGVYAMAILIVTRVIDYFKTLLTGGLAFIGTGIGIILLAVFVEMGRRRILDRVGGEKT